MAVLIQDIKLSIRQLLRRPIFSLVAVLTLAIGIGVNTVAFTVVNGVLFKGSAVSAKAGVGRILTTPGGDEQGYASLPEFVQFSDATQGAIDLAAEGRSTLTWRHDGVSETAWALFVTSNYFSMVDVHPVAGQTLVGRGAHGLPSAVIGERFWRRKLNAAPLAGLTLRLNDITVGVAGILPEDGTGPAGLYSPDVWLPLDDLRVFNAAPSLQKRDHRWLFIFGQLAAAVTPAEMQTRVDAAAARMAAEWPDTHTQRGARFRMIGEGNSELRGLSTGAAIAMGIISLVLLLACFNVANLLLARAIERERDIAIRAAVGASVMRLVRLTIIDGLVIATIAGIAAIVLSRWTQALMSSFAIPIEQPQHIDLTPDATVVAFTAGLVLIAGVLPGLWPALAAARIDVVRALSASSGNSSGSRTSTVRAALVAAQIAGSTAFLIIAGLLVQSYGHLAAVDLGFARDRLVVAELAPSSSGYDAARAEQYVRAFAARLRALPGVVDVAVADRAPFFIGFDRQMVVSSTGAACDAACPQYRVLAVDPAYFATLGVGLIAGRTFTAGEHDALIINQPLARELWPAGGGVGETILAGERGTPMTVIGITAQTHTRALDRESPTLYAPIAREQFEGVVTVVARTTAAPELLIRPVTEAATTIDANVAPLSVKTMEQRAAVQLWPFRTVSWLFSICGVLALVLGTVGLGGVVIHNVHRRGKEFGVRVSVGAAPGDLVKEVLAGSARLLVPGLIAGTLLAAGVARLVRAALVGVNVLDPSTYLAVALLECVIVLIACVGPARHAARIDPLVALRSD